MTRVHRCDPRSDYQCPECAERQLAEERERDGEGDAANLAAERVEAILGDEASVDVTADGFVSILVPADLAARVYLEDDTALIDQLRAAKEHIAALAARLEPDGGARAMVITRELRDCVQIALESAAMPMGDAIEGPLVAFLAEWDAS